MGALLCWHTGPYYMVEQRGTRDAGCYRVPRHANRVRSHGYPTGGAPPAPTRPSRPLFRSSLPLSCPPTTAVLHDPNGPRSSSSPSIPSSPPSSPEIAHYSAYTTLKPRHSTAKEDLTPAKIREAR